MLADTRQRTTHQDAATGPGHVETPSAPRGKRAGGPPPAGPAPGTSSKGPPSFVSPFEGAASRAAPWLRHEPLVRPGSPYVEAEVYFALDRATLGAEEQQTLNRASRLIARKTPAHVEVDGYADSRGSERHNEGLSERRVDAVVAVLDARLPASAAETISAVGHGETESGPEHARWRKVRVAARAGERRGPEPDTDREGVGGPTGSLRPLLEPEVLDEAELAWRAERRAIYERHLTSAAADALRGAGIPPKQVLDGVAAGLGEVQIDRLIEAGQKRLGIQLRASSVPAPAGEQPLPAARMSDLEVMTYELLGYRLAVVLDVVKARPELGRGIAASIRDLRGLLSRLELKARDPNRDAANPFAGLAGHERVEPEEGSP